MNRWIQFGAIGVLACGLMTGRSVGQTQTLVATGAVWKYLDNGTDQGTAWRGTNFNDSSWASGPARLGYGGDGETTLVSFGPNEANKYITTYFRHAFVVTNAASITGLTMRVSRDDGVAVYMNGSQVFLDGMESNIAFNVLATFTASSVEETNFLVQIVPPGFLVNGTNYLAAEVHQGSLGSSDLGFHLDLVAQTGATNVFPVVSIITPAAGTNFAAPATVPVEATASDPDGTIARVDLYTNGVFVRTETMVPYTWNTFPLYAGAYSLRAVAVDNRGGATTSAVVSISVTGNIPPVASITLPANNANFTGPADITVNASASDVDGSVAKVEFYRGGAKIGEDVSSPFGYTNTGVAVGAYQYTVVATDNLNARSATSAVVNVTVTANTPPTVSLTNPPSGASFIAPASITLGANATDAGGAVANVEFFANGGLLGSDNTSPFAFSWNSVTNGSYALTAVATDSGGLAATSAPVNITVTNLPAAFTNLLIATNSVWKYLDNGSDQGTPWRATAFNDSGWASGPAELGYGDADEATVVADNPTPGYDAVANDRYITTYFRHAFVVASAAAYTNLALTLLRDDGGIVYLNGTEVFRSPSMPAGPVAYDTLATGNGEDTVDTSNITSLAGLLIEGVNLIAVEIHQNAPTSSDVSFDLQLIGMAGTPPPSNAPPSVTVTTPMAGAMFASPANITVQAAASDPDGTVAQVNFYAGANLIGTDASAPYSVAWNGVTAAGYTLTAVATDDLGASTTSAPVNITVTGAANVLPTVTITAPPDGTTVTAPSTVTVTTTANDPDGSVTKVEFFRSGIKIGEDTTDPFGLEWTNAVVGSFQLTAIATDNNMGAGTSAPVSINFTSAAPATLIAVGSIWKYLDNGTNFDAIPWTALGFDDSAWLSGPGELGYGDAGDGRPEATVLGFGPNSASKYITYYFRHAFTAANPSAYSFLQARFMRDDGIVAYLNGVEIFRENLPAGAVSYQTLASNAGDDGAVFRTNAISTSLLATGDNVLAVEIHQNTPGSSDISFDLGLIGNTGAIVNNPPSSILTSPAEGNTYNEPASIALTASASDSDGSVSKVEFFANGAEVGEDTVAPFNFVLGGVGIGSYALRAVATDNLGTSTTSTVVNVSVTISTPPIVAARSPAPGTVSNLTAISVTFSETVDGVTAGDLLINNIPAAAVSGANSNYTFTFLQPMDGPVSVRFAAGHGITDRESTPKSFDETVAGASWAYTLADTVAPTVLSVDPVPSSTLRSFTKVTVRFSEAVGGVNASDLKVNGAAATSVSGSGAGPYVFGFTQPTIANPLLLILQWTNSHGIRDFSTAQNLLLTNQWTYLLNTNYVQTNIVINEIMYHPGHSQAGFVPEPVAEEYIEIHNRGATTVNLTGWRLGGGISFTFPAVNLAANGYLVVAANLTAFTNKYTNVITVLGPWTGRLGNGDNDLDLDDALGQRVDNVHYYDDGDWALRRLLPDELAGRPSWEWTTPADGGGSSLELINPRAPNQHGQNWAASLVGNGTPGRTNSVFATNAAPFILEVAHAPAVPTTADSVTITARVLDDQTNGVTATLFWRLGTNGAPVTNGMGFDSLPMFDDGLHNDGLTNDGVFGAIVPAQSNLAVVEFFVEATDAWSLARTWPGATDLNGTQAANALYQVTDEVYSGSQPLYRLVMTESENQRLADVNRNANAMAHAAFVSTDGTGTSIRYGVGIRHRGAGSRGAHPPNLRVRLTGDRKWKGVGALNLNTLYTHSQLIGSVLSRKAGLASEEAIAVQVRRGGTNAASANSPQYGSHIHLESRDGDWAANHFPLDANGNLYTGTRPNAGLTLVSPPTAANIDGSGYKKDTNQGDNDYSDIADLLSVLNPTPLDVAQYPAAVRQRVNVEQWLRYMAVLSLLGFGETSIGSDGQPDDYSMYRGAIDTRFNFFPHDHDTDMGQGDLSRQPPNNSIFRAGDGNPVVDRFLRHPEFVPLYYKELQQQLDGAFSLAEWTRQLDRSFATLPVSSQDISDMKVWLTNRYNSVRSQIPTNLTINPPALTVVSGFYRTTTASVSLSGQANAIDTRSVRVAGQGASWSAWQGTWSAGVSLQPGINRIVVQSLDAAGAELQRSVIDIWYDDGSVTSVSGSLGANTTWTAADGPYQVTANLSLAAGVTLTIQPGTTVYVNSGVTITIGGTARLLAEGSEGAHIRITRLPGSAGNWGSLDFLGAGTESRLSFVDIDSCGGTTLNGHHAQIHANNSRVFFDHLTFANTPSVQYISFDASSFIVQNSLFPAFPFSVNAPGMLNGINGLPAAGHGIFRGNYFGRTWMTNDTINFTGGQRPGPILQFIGNIFDGAGDEQLSLDSTDAWIEGNLFLHAHRDTNRTDDPLDTASAISGGLDVPGQFSEWTILNNFFYDVDHAVLNKGSSNAPGAGRFIFVNNTLVHVAKENGSGMTNDIAAFNFSDDSEPLPAPGYGAGAYVAGNIIWDAPQLIANYNAANHIVVFENNLLPLPWAGPGANNTVADPLLNLSLIANPLTADWRTVLAALTPRDGSPARGSGLGGFDKGGLNPRGLLVFGEPLGKTSDTNATLTVAPGGTFNWGTNAYEWGYTHYRWKLDDGAWSAETSITTSPRLTLTNLGAGLHTVYVSGRNDAGWYQDDAFVYPLDGGIPAHVTTSRSWTVNPMVPPVRLNEVLARNNAAVPVGAKFPDLIELFNPGSNTISLAGLGVTDEADKPFKFAFPGGATIGPGQYLLLYADSDATPPGHHLGFTLKQEGDEVFLTASNGMLFDSVVFGPQLADRSVGRLSDGSWTLCQPTFTGANVPASLGNPFTLRINEWLASGLTPYPDDFIELFNPDPLPVPLGELFLSDMPTSAPFLHDIAPLSFVVGGGYAVFIADGNASVDPTHLNFSLASEQGQIALSAADGSMIDCVIYGPQRTDVSAGRQPNGSVSFGTFTLPTPGAPNPGLAGTNGTLVINEVLAHNTVKRAADDSTPDWVEFFNPTTNALDMADMSLTDNTLVPRKFVFPPGSLVPALGFHALRLDPDTAVAPDNAGFGLKSSGQALYLFDKLANGGAQLNAVSFGVQAADFSIGRVPDGSTNWTLCAEKIGLANVAAPLGSTAALRVNEWMADPDGGDDWFELFNSSPQPVALGGLWLSDNITSPANRMKHRIAPLSFIGVQGWAYQRFEADGALASGPEHVIFSLSRDGEQLGISSAAGTLIDGISFGPQTLGVSEGRLADGAAFVTPFPGTASPGDPNHVPLASVVINETLTHSDPPLEDAIELRNLTAAPVDISGWWISDKKHDLQRFQVPTNTVIAANSFIVFYEYQFNDSNSPTPFSINSAQGDELYLAETVGGAMTGHRAEVDFGAAENAVSFGRYLTTVGEWHFVAMQQRTFGQDTAETVGQFRLGAGLVNSSPKVGPVVLNEIMYRPPDLGGTNDDTLNEFIELKNITGFNIPLFDPAHASNTWRLRDAVSFQFPTNVTLAPGGLALVVGFDPAVEVAQLNAFRAKYGVSPAAAIFGPWSGQLGNTSESVELVKPDAPQQPPDPDAGYVPFILADKVKYSSLPPWPDAGGNSNSLQRADSTEYGNDPINWIAAVPNPGPAGLVDGDGDGMPDAWEIQYFGNLSRNGLGDFDGDGLRDMDEYLAGTDPTNPSSVLRLIIISTSPTLLGFNAADGKTYTVEFKNTLDAPSWTILATVAAGPAGPVQVPDPAPHPAYRFYRVRTP